MTGRHIDPDRYVGHTPACESDCRHWWLMTRSDVIHGEYNEQGARHRFASWSWVCGYTHFYKRGRHETVAI